MSKVEGVKEGSSAASALSFASGVIIILGATLPWVWHSAFYPSMGWMMRAPTITPLLSSMFIIGIVSGAIVLFGAYMMSSRPSESYKWGVIVLIFSILSFLGMGGFLIGAVLGIAGGILAMAKR